MIIAIDFDGTCVTHEYPNIGKDIGAVSVLKKLVKKGHQLILFTMRSGQGLEEAIKWFNINDIKLYGVQFNPEQAKWTASNKCYAQLYIDDAALGCPLIYPSKNIVENPQLYTDSQYTKRNYVVSDRPYVDWYEVEKYFLKNELI